MTDDDDILAAEFALGLLDESEAHAVQRRARTDQVLSLRIAWWRDQLAPLANEVETPVPDHLWSRINATIPGNDNVVDTARPWKFATGGMGLVAAGLLAFVATQPSIPTPAPTPGVRQTVPPLLAALSGEKGATVAISYDETAGTLTIAPTVLDPGKGDAELWIVPAGGTPISLGIVDARTPQKHNVPDKDRSLVKPGATFAITQEVKGGSPTGKAQGPIVAAGKIIRT